MNLAKQGKKFDELLDKLNYTDDQKAYVYLTITQFVDRQLEDLIIATLSQEDMDHI